MNLSCDRVKKSAICLLIDEQNDFKTDELIAPSQQLQPLGLRDLSDPSCLLPQLDIGYLKAALQNQSVLQCCSMGAMCMPLWCMVCLIAWVCRAASKPLYDDQSLCDQGVWQSQHYPALAASGSIAVDLEDGCEGLLGHLHPAKHLQQHSACHLHTMRLCNTLACALPVHW